MKRLSISLRFFLFSFKGDWERAAYYAGKLSTESKWSKVCKNVRPLSFRRSLVIFSVIKCLEKHFKFKMTSVGTFNAYINVLI